jgi:pimeloyl-ACP methyl ester carboxylesterase
MNNTANRQRLYRAPPLATRESSGVPCQPTFPTMRSCPTILLPLAGCIGLLPLPWRTASATDPNAFPANPIPQSVTELWSGFDPRKDPLETEILKSWEQDGVACRIVRYQVGVFKGAPAKVAAFHAYPIGKTKLPGLLDIHGGGQSASLESVIAWARRGYACVSINWGGNKLNFGRTPMTYDGPQTDWGRLDATHPPQRNKVNHFAAILTPDDFTLDPVESPRNSNWFLVLMAARRAITFLEQQPEVNPDRIGVFGHSMGGKITTDLAGIDKRVKAAVPSCGGSGDILDSQIELPGCRKTKPDPMELACISDNAYIPLITCPVLWLSPTNDFHAHIDNMA